MEPYFYEDVSIDEFFFFQNMPPPFPILNSMRSLNNVLENRELTLPHKRSGQKNCAGFGLELFLVPPPKQFICQICKKVVRKAADCPKCGELFCETCIVPDSILTPTTKGFCITCDCMITPKSCSTLLTKIIGEQKIKCKNSEIGCTCIFNLVDILKHDMVCPYRQVSCMNYENCGNIGYLKDFREIESPCRSHVRGVGWNSHLKPYTCSETCQKFIIFKDLVKDKQGEKVLKEYLDLLTEINKRSQE